MIMTRLMPPFAPKKKVWLNGADGQSPVVTRRMVNGSRVLQRGALVGGNIDSGA
jgi:hypothetical protein